MTNCVNEVEKERRERGKGEEKDISFFIFACKRWIDREKYLKM